MTDVGLDRANQQRFLAVLAEQAVYGVELLRVTHLHHIMLIIAALVKTLNARDLPSYLDPNRPDVSGDPDPELDEPPNCANISPAQ